MSRTTQTTNRLREMILTGEYASGERLLEVPLGEQLGVSRTPIRAALQKLASEGLIEERPSVGYVVRAFTLRDLEDSLEMRGSVEGLAARMAAQRLTDVSDLDPIRACVEQIDAIVDKRPIATTELERFFDLNQQFHNGLRQLAQSFTVDHIMLHVSGMPFASPNAFVRLGLEGAETWKLIFLANEDHRSIVQAIEDRDARRAENLAREHARLRTPFRRIMSTYFNTSDKDPLPVSILVRELQLPVRDQADA